MEQSISRTIKSYTTSNSGGDGARIKAIATPKTVVITRTPHGGNSSGSVVREVEMRRSTGALNSINGSSAGVHSGVSNIMENREREKKDMRDLNERFANYIEKVRFLEAQNKKLANELATLRDRWGKETERIKQMYDVEMVQLRKILDDSSKSKAELEVKVNSLEETVDDLQKQLDAANQLHNADRDMIDRLNSQVSDQESELNVLRRRIASFESDHARDKAEIQRLRDEVRRLRMDLDQETLNHINAEQEAHSLRDEIDFLKKVHDSELKELAALAYRDTTQENREFWRSEMSQCLRDIQNEYDNKLDVMQSEMETHYNLKIQESRTNSSRGGAELQHTKDENIRIKQQLGELRDRIPELEARNAQLERLIEELRRDSEERLRDWELERSSLRKSLSDNQAELEAVLVELQALLDAKLSLELEIAAYRKLLEGEESRAGLRNLVEETMKRSSDFETTRVVETRKTHAMPPSNTNMGIIKGEMSAKTTYQRTAKGNISIQECSPDGKFVTIENTGKKREEISGMRITRNVDNGRQIIRFTFPEKTFLEPEGRGKSIKVWARSLKPSGSSDMECNENTWGNGANIHTVLISNDGEEKATHTQRTVYQSN